jgi:hypothetical protein
MVNSMTGGPGRFRRLHASHLPGPADVFWRKKGGEKGVFFFFEKWWVFMDFHGKEKVFHGCFFEDF